MDSHSTSARYEVRVRGLLTATLLGAFPGLEARAESGDTLLCGSMPDQAALHGVLGQVEALGLELIEVRRSDIRLGARDSSSHPVDARSSTCPGYSSHGVHRERANTVQKQRKEQNE
jgi:hypothetical protein